MAKKTVFDLKQKYKEEIIPELMKKYGYKNIHEVPKVTKIVINRGIGEAVLNSKSVQESVDEFRDFFGQQPVVTKAKKSIAGFKVREGMSIGCKVTLRGDNMYMFMNKLFGIILPKIRDFRGVPRKAFDNEANYNLGLKEQLIFPEVNFDKTDKVRGMNITFVTSTTIQEQSLELLALLGMPFRKN